MAVTVFTLFSKERRLGGLALAYALHIGFGGSMTIHRFLDFTTEAIFDSVIGLVVRKKFRAEVPSLRRFRDISP